MSIQALSSVNQVNRLHSTFTVIHRTDCAFRLPSVYSCTIRRCSCALLLFLNDFRIRSRSSGANRAKSYSYRDFLLLLLLLKRFSLLEKNVLGVFYYYVVVPAAEILRSNIERQNNAAKYTSVFIALIFQVCTA